MTSIDKVIFAMKMAKAEQFAPKIVVETWTKDYGQTKIQPTSMVTLEMRILACPRGESLTIWF